MGFARHGYRVLSVGDGVEALAVWREYRTDVNLMVTDLVKPAGLSGPKLAQRLPADRVELRVIFVSGYCAEIAGQDLELRPGDPFVQQPCPPLGGALRWRRSQPASGGRCPGAASLGCT